MLNMQTQYQRNDAPAVLSPEQQKAIMVYAEKMDMPAEGITLLGGKPYPNFTGLSSKALKLGMRSLRVEIVREATSENGLSASAKATVLMSDGAVYDDIGLASKASVKMTSLHNADFLTMMAATRAKNRALRNATGVGHVSAEEIQEAKNMFADSTNLDFIEDESLGLEGGEGEGYKLASETTITPIEGGVRTDTVVTFPTAKEADEQLLDALKNPPEKPLASAIAMKQDQVNHLRSLIQQAKKDEGKILAYFKQNSLEDLSEEQFKKATENLTASIAQMVMYPPQTAAPPTPPLPPVTTPNVPLDLFLIPSVQA